MTDEQRLAAAFALLASERRIITGRDLGYTQQDGWGDVNSAAADWPKPPRAAVFYDRQAAARARAGEGLFLTFGVYDGGDAASARIAGEIVDVLQAHGLAVTWDGSVHTRIHVHPFAMGEGAPPDAPPVSHDAEVRAFVDGLVLAGTITFVAGADRAAFERDLAARLPRFLDQEPRFVGERTIAWLERQDAVEDVFFDDASAAYESLGMQMRQRFKKLRRS